MSKGPSTVRGLVGLFSGIGCLILGSTVHSSAPFVAAGLTVLGCGLTLYVPAWYWTVTALDESRGIIVGAIALPIGVIGYLLLLGYPSILTDPAEWRPILFFVGPANFAQLVVLILPLALLGGLTWPAVKRDLRVPLATILLTLVGLPLLRVAEVGPLQFGRPPLFGSTVFPAGEVDFNSFAPAAGLLVELLLVLVAMEYAIRCRDELDRVLPPRPRRLGGIAGGLSLLLLPTLGLASGQWTGDWTLSDALESLLSVAPLEILYIVHGSVGLVLLGAVPVIAFARWRLVTPLVFAGVVVLFTAWLTVEWAEPPTRYVISPQDRGAPPTVRYALWWFYPVVCMVSLGVIEHRVRAFVGLTGTT